MRMKARESGVPEEVFWQSFYDADCIVEKLRCATDFYRTAAGNKKTAQPWRLSAGVTAYAHEPAQQ